MCVCACVFQRMQFHAVLPSPRKMEQKTNDDQIMEYFKQQVLLLKEKACRGMQDNNKGHHLYSMVMKCQLAFLMMIIHHACKH